MEIKKSNQNEVEVFELSGRIDANNAKEIEGELVNCIDEGKLKILVDLSNLEYISSSGLRVFLLIAKKIGKEGFVRLCSLQPQVLQIFTISGFNKIFSIFDTKEEALNS